MEPFYISNNGEQLFTIYHPAAGTGNSDIAVICCYPFAQEYIRAHKAYLKLAMKLAQSCHVMRFDFTGCGDSYGDLEDVTLVKWIDNIHTVISEIKSSMDIKQIYLFGVRLGGTLAMLYNALYEVDGLILISPVVNGAPYLTETADRHNAWLKGSYVDSRHIHENEWLGFQLPKSLVQEIKDINLAKHVLKVKNKVLLFDNEKGDCGAVIKKILPSQLQPDIKVGKNDGFWIKNDDQSKNVLPLEEIEIIYNWIQK
jgi:pimeloyl-ACP methyl ester carboxylesterase